MSTANWNALLLAGGRSTRMGRDKAMLDWHGQPLLAAQLQHLKQLGATQLRVSGDYPEYGGIPDTHPDLGPIGGLHGALAAATDGCWLVVPIDMPVLQWSHLQPLIEAPPALSAICYRHHMLPLRLILDDRVRMLLNVLIDRPDPQLGRSLRALHAGLAGAYIDCPNALLAGLSNCNTPQEWQALSQ